MNNKDIIILKKILNEIQVIKGIILELNLELFLEDEKSKRAVCMTLINKGVNIHKVLREKAKRLNVGESGLVALDWWNGNRSVLVDVDLTGMLIGCTLEN